MHQIGGWLNLIFSRRKHKIMQTITFETAILGRITIDLQKNEVNFEKTNAIEKLRRNDEGEWGFSHVGWGEFGVEFLGRNRWALRRRTWETISETSRSSDAFRRVKAASVR